MKEKYLMICLFLGLAVFSNSDFAKNIIIRSVAFNHATLPQVVKQLQRDYPVNIVLRATKQELAETPLITLQLQNIPFYPLIHYICMLSNMAYAIDGELLLIGRRLEKNMPLRPDLFKPDPLAGIPPGTRISIGRSYYVPIAWSPAKTVVTGNTTTYISPVPTRFIKMNSGVSMGHTGVATHPAKKHRNQIKHDNPKYRVLRWRHIMNNLNLTNRLRSRIVELDLDDVPLVKAIAKIRALSVNPHARHKKPINFIIMPFAGMDKIKVTCYFNNLNLLSSLKYICKASGVKYQIDKYAVVIYKPVAKQRKK